MHCKFIINHNKRVDILRKNSIFSSSYFFDKSKNKINKKKFVFVLFKRKTPYANVGREINIYIHTHKQLIP